MVSKIQPHWKNPYKAKRIDRVSNTSKPDSTNSNKPNTNQNDVLLMMNNLQEGVKGISSSIQQFEKTMESLTQLYQTIDKLGGFKKLNEIIAPASTPQRSSSNFYNLSSLSNQLQSLLAILQKIDFQQINQFIESTLLQGVPNDSTSKKS